MIKRLFIRAFFHSIRFLIKILEGRFSRLYMYIFNRILKMVGVSISGEGP
jgi:hypothetical protein